MTISRTCSWASFPLTVVRPAARLTGRPRRRPALARRASLTSTPIRPGGREQRRVPFRLSSFHYLRNASPGGCPPPLIRQTWPKLSLHHPMWTSLVGCLTSGSGRSTTSALRNMTIKETSYRTASSATMKKAMGAPNSASGIVTAIHPVAVVILDATFLVLT